jgi:hypothetical protein
MELRRAVGTHCGQRPDADAQVQGERRITWAEFDRRADGLARYLLDRGRRHQDKVALYLHNCPEYLESCSLATRRAGPGEHQLPLRRRRTRLPVGQRRRGGGRLPRHVHRRVDAVRNRVPKVPPGSGSTTARGRAPTGRCPTRGGRHVPPAGAIRPMAEWGRSGDDIFMIYTGGTTGMPKGVMWRQDDLIRALCHRQPPAGRGPREVWLRRRPREDRRPTAPGLPPAR